MLLEKILKQITKKNTKKISAKIPDEDFIPYACHYDPYTILTKNGELMQTICISGFSKESIADELISLRDTLRDSISDNVKDNHFAFWFHTIRRKKNISSQEKYPDYLSNKIHQQWVEKNNWEDQFVNELYITIIIEGFDSSISNLSAFSRSFSYKATHKLHKKHLEESLKNLSKISLKILADIEGYGAKILTINELDNVLYSEPMNFLGKIINLYEKNYPLSVNDISTDLSNNKIAFGAREIQVSDEKDKHFASIFTLKEYHEVGTTALEKIMQLPLEFIITQSFDFSCDKKDLEDQIYQDKILQISGDANFRQASGIANFVESDNGLDTDYGKLQTSIMLINKTAAQLEKNIALIVEKFSSLGFILVREDVFSEHCFWAQLPGNFTFLRRQKVINTLRIAGFASLHSFPVGSIAQNHWGESVTTLPTILNTPYFFNFHDQDLGHSLILGPQGSGKTTLVNFLLSEARKFNNKIFYFDSNQSSKAFIKALSGSYHSLTSNINNADFLQMNPFSLPNNEENAAFLGEWIQQLVVFLKGDIPESEINAIPQVVAKVLQSSEPSFIAAFDAFKNNPATKNLYEKLKIWGNGKLAYIFGSQTEIDWKNQIHAFDLNEIAQQKPVVIPVVDYLLHRIEVNLDGSPTLIIIDDAFELLDNKILAPQLHNLLQRFRQKNCSIIFIAKSNEKISQSLIAKDINENTALKIYLPNKEPQDYYKTTFEISDEEFDIIQEIDLSKRQFLLKHCGDSIIATLNLENLDTVKILATDQFGSAATDEIINSKQAEDPNKKIEPQDWINNLIEIIKENESEQYAEKILLEKEELAKAKKLKEELEK